MQNIWRRSISMFLAVVMILSNVPLQVLAQETVPGGEETIPAASSTVLESSSQEAAEPSSEPETSEEVTETTEAPTETTEAPTETTEAPTETTEAPTETTQAPPETTEAPAESGEASEPPVDEAVQAVQAMIDALVIPDEADYEDEETEEAWENALAELEEALWAIDEACADFTEEQHAQLDDTKYSDAWTVINEYWLAITPAAIKISGKGTEDDPYVYEALGGVMTNATIASSLQKDFGFTWYSGTFIKGIKVNGTNIKTVNASGNYTYTDNTALKVEYAYYNSLKDNGWRTAGYAKIVTCYDIKLNTVTNGAVLNTQPSLSGTKSPSGNYYRPGTVTINVPSVDGYNAVVTFNGTPVTVENGVATIDAATGDVVVTYNSTAAQSYTVTVETNGLSGCNASAKQESGYQGDKIGLNITMPANTASANYSYTVQVTGEGASYNASTNEVTIGTSAVAVKVTFSVQTLNAKSSSEDSPINVGYNPAKTIANQMGSNAVISVGSNAGKSVEQMIFETVLDSSNIEGLKYTDFNYQYYAYRKAIIVDSAEGWYSLDRTGLSNAYEFGEADSTNIMKKCEHVRLFYKNNTSLYMDVYIKLVDCRPTVSVAASSTLPNPLVMEATDTLAAETAKGYVTVTMMEGGTALGTTTSYSVTPTVTVPDEGQTVNDQTNYLTVTVNSTETHQAGSGTIYVSVYNPHYPAQLVLSADAYSTLGVFTEKECTNQVKELGNAATYYIKVGVTEEGNAAGYDPGEPTIDGGLTLTDLGSGVYSFKTEEGPASVPPAKTYTITLSAVLRDYTITWENDANGDGDCDDEGETTVTENVAHGSEIDFPADPEKNATNTEVFAFREWQLTSGTVTDGKIYSGLVYTAVYDASTRYYTVQWDTNGDGTLDNTLDESYTKYKYEDPLKVPDAAGAGAGFTFQGWKNSGGTVYPAANLPKVTKDETYTAYYTENPTCKVTVVYNDGGTANGEVTVDKDGALTLSDPTRDNYAFEGWYTDAECTPENKVTLPITVSEDMTIYANWTPKYYVTFDARFAENIENTVKVDAQEITKGQTASMPANFVVGQLYEDPAGNSYRFNGWKNKASGSLVKFPLTVNEAITLTADWTRQWTVTFDANNGADIAITIEKVFNDEKVAKPKEDPDKDFGAFDAWYLGTEAYDFTKPVKSDLTLVANYHTDENNNNVRDDVEMITVAVDGSATIAITNATDKGNGSWLVNTKEDLHVITVDPTGAADYVADFTVDNGEDLAETDKVTYASCTLSYSTKLAGNEAIQVKIGTRVLKTQNIDVPTNGYNGDRDKTRIAAAYRTYMTCENLITEPKQDTYGSEFVAWMVARLGDIKTSEIDKTLHFAYLDAPAEGAHRNVYVVWNGDDRYPTVTSAKTTAYIKESREEATITSTLPETLTMEAAPEGGLDFTDDFKTDKGTLKVTHTGEKAFPDEGETVTYTVTASVADSEACLAATLEKTVAITNPKYDPKIVMGTVTDGSMAIYTKYDDGELDGELTDEALEETVTPGTYYIKVTPKEGYNPAAPTIVDKNNTEAEVDVTDLGEGIYSFEANHAATKAERITYTVTAECPIRTYTVQWYNGERCLERDFNVPHHIESDSEKHSYPNYGGSKPEAPAATDEFTYTFDGWTNGTKDEDGKLIVYGTTENPLPPVTGDVEYVAHFAATTNQYTVIWQNDANGDGDYEDENEVETKTLDYGTVPTHPATNPTKAANAQYTYNFDKWVADANVDPEGKIIGNVTYTATYTKTINKYTVTWQNDANGDEDYEDENEVETKTLDYGTVPIHPATNPTKAANAQYTYAFDKWVADKNVDAEGKIIGNVIYTATYTKTTNKYTVIWTDDDGTELEKDTDVAYGTKPEYSGTMPTKPSDEKYNYTFQAWIADPKENVAEDGTIKGDVTYKAYYSTATLYEIRIYNDPTDGEKYAEYLREAGQGVTLATPDERNDYHFLGWYDAKGNKLTGNTVTIDSADPQDVYVYAQWAPKYQVSFQSEHQAVGTQYIVQNSQASEPASPKIGDEVENASGKFVFQGWYADAEFKTAFDFANKAIEADTIIYAKWTPKYEVSFNSKYQAVASQYILEGSVASLPTSLTVGDQVKTGEDSFVFKGWYADSDFKNEFDFANTAITDNTTIYAKWIPLWKVTFDTDMSTDQVDAQIIEDGKTATAPANNPTRNKKIFLYWYEVDGTPFDFENTKIEKNITLTAKYGDDTDEDGKEDGTPADPFHVYIWQNKEGVHHKSVTVLDGVEADKIPTAPDSVKLDKDTKDLAFTGWSETVTTEGYITYQNKSVYAYTHTTFSNWETDRNNNDVADSLETIQVAITGNGTVKINGAPVTNGSSYLYDSTTNSNTIVAAPTSWSTAHDYVESIANNGTELTSGTTGFADGVFTKETVAFSNGTTLKVTFGQRKMVLANNPTVSVNGYKTTLDYDNVRSEYNNKITPAALLDLDQCVGGSKANSAFKIQMWASYKMEVLGNQIGTEEYVDLDSRWLAANHFDVNANKTMKITWKGDARYPEIVKEGINVRINESRKPVAPADIALDATKLGSYNTIEDLKTAATALLSAKDNNGAAIANPSWDVQVTGTFPGKVTISAKVTNDGASWLKSSTAAAFQVDGKINYYTITWLDGDSTAENPIELTTTSVAYGEVPAYPANGTTPTKTATNEWTYTWNGWSPELTAVTGDASYTAAFDQTHTIHNIYWDTNGDGDITDDTDVVTQVAYGDIPDATNIPSYPPENQFFAAWSPALAPVTGETTYTATFSNDTIYTITFMYDGKVWDTYSINVTDEPDEKIAAPEKGNPDKDFAIFTGWTNANVIGTVPTGDVTLVAQWNYDDTNNNNVDDSDFETITVEITGNGSVKIDDFTIENDGDTEYKETYVFDSTKSPNVIQFIPGDKDGSDGSANFVESVKIGMAGTSNTNLANSSNYSYSNYILTVDHLDNSSNNETLANGWTVEAIFGTRTLGVKSEPIEIGIDGNGNTIIKTKVREAYQKHMTAANLVTEPVQVSYGSEFVVYLKTTARGDVDVTKLSDILDIAALDGPPAVKNGYVQWTGDSRYPTIKSAQWTANIVDIRPQAYIEIGNLSEVIEFNSASEIQAAILKATKMYYEDGNGQKVYVENLASVLDVTLEGTVFGYGDSVSEDWTTDGKTQTLKYKVGPKILDIFGETPYVKPESTTVEVKAQGIVHPAKITVTNDDTAGKISIASGDFDAHQYTNYTVPFTVTPADGYYVESVKVGKTVLSGSYANTVFSASFPIVNGDVTNGTRTDSTYDVVVTYGKRSLVAKQTINPITYNPDMGKIYPAVFNVAVDVDASTQGVPEDAQYKVSCEDVKIGLAEGQTWTSPAKDAIVPYTFIITWPASDKYPARTMEVEVKVMNALAFNVAQKWEVKLGDYGEGNYADYLATMEAAIRDEIQKNFPQVHQDDIKITLPDSLPILTQGESQEVKVGIYVYPSAAYDEAKDVAVFTLTGMVETAVVKVETAQGGDVKHTAPVAAANTNHVFEAVPAENFFLDTMTITRQDVAPGQTAAVAEADPTFPMSLTWQDFTNGKVTVQLPNGDGLALGVVPTYTVTAAFVDPAIVIEANREVGFNPFWEDLEGELLKQLTKAQEDGSAPVAAATPEQLLTVPAVPEAVGETNEVKVEYRVREKAEYTVKISLDFIDIPGIDTLLQGRTIDIPMTLEELWASPDQEFASKEVDVEQLIKDSYDEIVNMSDLPTPDLSDISGYISKLTEYFTGKFNALLDPYRDGMFVHNFGDMRDENGAKTNTEIIRITSTSARFGKVVSDSQVVTLKDIRTETALTLTNPSVTMTYGFPEADLTAALVPVITALAEEGEQVIDGSIVYVDKVADLDASDTAYTITVRYPGSYDYQDAEAKATVLVNKDSATVTVESKTMKYTGKPADVSFTAVGNTYGKNADMAKFIVGLNVSDFGVDFENKTVVGLEGDLILILPESIQKWLDLIPGFDGVDMEINELGDALNTILEMLGVGGEGSSDVINSLLNVLNMLPEAVDLRITLGDDSHMPSDIGVYLTGAVTLDSNFETAFNVGYLLITPDGYQAELGWIMEDSNGIISHDLLQNKEIFDMGPKVLSVLEGTVEEAQQYATQIFLGISVNNAANGNNTIDEIILTTDQTQLPFGAYVEIGLLTDFGNTMYYAVPVVRAFAVIPETVKVELLDANGNQNRDLKLDFNGQPQGFEVKVSDREGNLILNTFENVGSTEHLILKYYGLKTNIETYDSSDKPDHSGGYAALAVYLEKDAAGNIQAFGVDVGAMVIEPSKSTIAVGDDVKVYDGKSYDVAALIDAKSVNVSALTPDTTVVTAQLTTDMSFEQNGLGAIQGAANMDFPVWLDKILSEKYPDAFANGINAGDFAAKLAQYTDKLKELGITEEMLAELTNVLNSIPSDVRLTFHDLADVAPTEIGAYVVVGIVTDPNHYPAVDAGLLVITPATTEAVLKFTDNDSNNIYMVDTLKFKDLNADAYVNDVYNEDATALVTNLFVGININGETVTTTDYTTLLPGEYLQLSYILDLRQELYYAVPITRLITVAPNLYDISIWNNGVEDLFRQHTYDATPKSIGDIKITDQKGQPVTVNADEGDDLTVTYYGVNLPVEGYKSTDLPTDAGAYVALVTFVDYDENGSCIGVGITAGAMIINLADGTLVVEEDTVTYNGLEQFPKVTLRSGNLVEETDCAAIIVETYTDHSVEPAAQAKQMRIVLDDDLRAMLKKAEDLLGYEIPEVIDTPEVLTDIVDVLKKVTSVTTSEELQSIMDLLPEDVRNKVDDILAQVNPAAEELITLLETAAAVLPEVMPEAATVLVDSAKPVDAGTYEIYALSVSKNFMPEMMTQPAVFQILPVDINVAIQDAEKFYGDPDPALAYAVTYTDVDGETVTLDYLPEVVLDAYATMPMPVRNQKHTIVVSPDALLKAEDKRNFTINSITGTAGQNAYLNIKPAEVSISVADQTKVYGEVDPEAPYTWEVLKGKVTEEELKDVLELVVARIAGENVGSYDYSLSYLDCAYITVTADEMGALSITPAPLSVTVKDAEKLCLAPNPAFDYEVQGLVNEDDKGSVVVTYSCETGSNTAGTYPINATAENDNYDITVIPGTLTICHSEQTMNAVDPTCTDTGLTEGTKCSACGEILTAQETVDALGHDWNETTYTWTGYTACTAERVCKRDAGHKLTLSAVITEEVTIAPLCESEGLMTYTAAFDTDWAETQAVTQVLNALGHDWDDGVITTQPTCTEKGVITFTCGNDKSHTRTEDKPARGHTWQDVEALAPTCTVPGHTEGAKCAVSDCSFVFWGLEELPATGHSFGEWYESKAPSCTEKGEERRDCGKCSHFETREAEKAAHSYTTAVTAPTCTERGYTTYTCSCGDSYVDDYVNALSHSYTAVVTAPTCEADGYTTYTCVEGDHSYVGDHQNATGHNYVGEVTTQPTCTETGVKTFTCKNDPAHTYTSVVAATGHNYQTKVTAPTCTEQGYTTYTCACGSSYDADYVDATDHAWDNGKVTTAPACTANGEMTFTCGNDSTHTRTEPIPATGHIDEDKDYVCDVCGEKLCKEHQEQVISGYAAACEASGLTDGKKCSICGEILVPQTVISATGHNYVGEVTTEPTCTETGVKTYVCQNDKSHTYTEDVPAAGHSYSAAVTAPTCTEQGYTTHTCACGESYQDTYVDALGHDWNLGVITELPSCTDTGVRTYTCRNDKSHTYTEEIPAIGHSHSAVITAPTCTERGYTTYTCICGDSYVDDYVAATGHTYGQWKQTTAPSCTDEGEERRDCVHCDAFETRKVAVTDHTYTSVVTAPTCTEKGYTTHTCACGHSYKDTYVAAAGHDMGQWTEVKAPTCTESGTERRDCAACDHFEERELKATGHTLGAWYQSKAPDCTDKGEDRRDCADCDYFETKEVEATGHSFGEWYESKAATPSKPGEERRDCANCDHFETREIPALGRITITKDHVKLGTKLTYNGKEQTKKLTITVDGKTLVEGTDFTVTGRTGTDAGSYTMTITGLGDYTGTVGVKWNIYARKVTVKLDSHTVKVGDKLPKWTYKVTTGTVAEGDTLKLTITCKAKDTKKTGTYSITGKDNDPNYEITVKSGKLTVVENRDGLYPVYFDPNVSIAPGAEVEIDGVPYTLDNDSIAWLDHEDAKLATSYKFKENDDPHKTYPTHMYVWLLTLEDSDGDGKKDCYQAERVTELDNFMMYHGTSIRVNHTSNGIRFFTSMPSGSLDKLISGKLLTGSLKGYKLVRAGTLFKWYEGDDTVTLDNAVSSDVYGGKAGKNFRVYQSSNGRDWFTGMLTGLEGDAKTLNRDLLARPFMVLERNGKQITIYGGTIQRSIYYVATQNRNHWAAGTVYDNYVEDIIAKAEKGKS